MKYNRVRIVAIMLAMTTFVSANDPSALKIGKVLATPITDIKNGTQENLKEIRIRNNYDGMVDVSLMWDMEKPPHTQIISNPSIPGKKTMTYKAPFVGYSLRRMSAISSSTVGEIAGTAIVAVGTMGSGAIADEAIAASIDVATSAISLSSTAAIIGDAIVTADAKAQSIEVADAAHTTNMCSKDKIDAGDNTFFLFTGEQQSKSVIIWRYKDEQAFTDDNKRIAQINKYKQVDIQALTKETIAKFTPYDIAFFTLTQKSYFSDTQIALLTPTQMKYFAYPLTADQITLLSPAEIKILTPSQIKKFTPAQVAKLTAAQRAAFAPTQLTYLTTAPIPKAVQQPSKADKGAKKAGAVLVKTFSVE